MTSVSAALRGMSEEIEGRKWKNSKMRGIVVKKKGRRGQTEKGKDRERDIRARQGS